MTHLSRVAVIGSTGQLGTDVVEILSACGCFDITPVPETHLDVTDRNSVRQSLRKERFEIVINCAAYTRVDDCEDRAEEALRVNALGAWEVARACSEIGALCVHISTDYVFSGEKGGPYTEEDRPAPVNVYGASKAAGEMLVQQAARRWLTVRIASLFGKAGSQGKGGNFVDTILSRARAGEHVRAVNDIWMSPTYTVDVARILEALIQAGATGIYHATNYGCCSWYQFASEAIRMAGIEVEVEPIPSSAYPSKARRPKDSSLRSVRMERTLGHSLRPWQEALQAYLVEKGWKSTTDAPRCLTPSSNWRDNGR